MHRSKKGTENEEYRRTFNDKSEARQLLLNHEKYVAFGQRRVCASNLLEEKRQAPNE